MDLTRALKDVRFDLVMRGYDCDAVDAFLAKARGEVAEIISQRDAARSRIDELESSGESDAEGTLRRTLVLAQRLADETVADAKQTAEAMVEAATTEATTTKDQARSEADSILREANEEAAESRTAARQELERANEDAARVSEQSAVDAQQSREETVAHAATILSEAEQTGQERVTALEAEAKAEVARMREPIRAEIAQLEDTRASLLRDIEALEEHLGEQRVRVRTAVESLRAGMSGSIDDLERVAADEDAMSLAARPVLENQMSAAVDEAPDVDIIDSVNDATEPAPTADALADTVIADSVVTDTLVADATSDDHVVDDHEPDETADIGHDGGDLSDAEFDEPVSFDEPVVVDDSGPATEPISVIGADGADAEHGEDALDSTAPEDAVAEVVDLDAAPSAIFGTDVADDQGVVDAEMVEVTDSDLDAADAGADAEIAAEVDADDRPFLERFTSAIGDLPIQRGR